MISPTDLDAKLWPDDKFDWSGTQQGFFGLTDDRFHYFVSRELISDSPAIISEHRIAITEYLKNSGKTTTYIDSESIPEISTFPVPTTRDKLDRLLKLLYKRNKEKTDHLRLSDGISHIVWDTADDLRSKLFNRIGATIE